MADLRLFSSIKWKERTTDLWVILVSTLTGLLCSEVYFRTADTELTNFNNRAIGICALMGVDPNLRAEIFIKLVFIFIAIFCLTYLICSFFSHRLSRRPGSFRFCVEKSAVSILSGAAIADFMLMVFTENQAYGRTAYALAVLTGLVFLFTAGKYIFLKFHQGRRNRYLQDYAVLAVSLALPYQLILGYHAFFEKILVFDLRFLFLYCALWSSVYLLFVLIHVLFRNAPGVQQSRLNNAFIAAGIPLVMIPFSMPLANEIQFSLARLYYIHPEIIAALFILMLVFGSGFIGIHCLRGGRFGFRKSFLVSNVYYPVILASDILFNQYIHQLTFKKFDLFHVAEGVLPVHQLFRFNSIPFVDYYPMHGFFDMFPQFFYRLLNGERGLEMLLWGNGYMNGWLPSIIAYLLLYALLKKYTSPLFSLVVLVCTPATHLFHPYYSMFILPALSLYFTLKSPTPARMALSWLTILFLTLWRVDFGIAATAASLFILAGSSWTGSGPGPKTILTSLFMVFGSAILLFSFAAVIRNRSPLELVMQYMAVPLIQIPIASYTHFFKAYDSTVVLQYFILPAVSVCYIVSYTIRVFLFKKPIEPLKHILGLLAVVSLILSLRSFNRHSLYEGIFNPYLFVFLAGLVPFYFSAIKKSFSMGFLLTVSMIFYFLIPHNRLFMDPRYTFSKTDKNPVSAVSRQIFTFHPWGREDSRVVLKDTSNDNVVRFLNHYLKNDQTFYDFSNATLLYFLADRKYPAYIPEAAYHASETIQNYLLGELNDYRGKDQLPLVVFRQNNFWDSLDGVPQEVRAYRVSEYIYKNYAPLVNVDNFEIWADSSLPLQRVKAEVEQDVHKRGKEYPLKVYPPKTTQDAVIMTDSLNVKLRFESRKAFAESFLDFSELPVLDMANRYYLKITCRVSKSGPLKFYFSFNGAPFKPSEPVTFHPDDRVTKGFAVIFVPVLANEPKPVRLSDVRMGTPENTTVEMAKLELVEINGDTNSFTNPFAITTVDAENYQQHFNLHQLPHVWGSYDALDPVNRAETLFDLKNAMPCQIQSGSPLNLSFDSDMDKTSGNYLHLSIQSDKPAEVTISYGFGAKSSFIFTVRPSPHFENYLIRMSSQWEWMHHAVSVLTINTTGTVRLNTARILKGD